MNKLLLVDGNSIANRAFYALPFLSNQAGAPSGAIYGFANIILKLLQTEKPTHVVVAFDYARKTFRNDIYDDYKMQRKPTPPELLEQFPMIKQMLVAMNIKYFEIPGIEADDIIGTLAKKFDEEKLILSGDRDLLQLIDDRTQVWLTKKGVTEVDKVDEVRLYEMFGLKPYQIIDMKGLMGDTSDNIPGVRGVGEKSALSLLSKYDTVEDVYNNVNNITGKLKEKLLLDKEMAFISKQLATINRNCQIEINFEDCRLKMPFGDDLFEFFRKMDFSTLLKNNNIFDLNSRKEENKLTFKNLTSEVLDKILRSKINVICYDLHQIKFLFEDTIYSLYQNFSMFEEEISFEDVCKKLKSIFEDEKILKITSQAKKDMHLLSKLGISLNNYFDLSVAEYLIQAGSKASTIDTELSNYGARKIEVEKAIKDNKLEFVYNEIEKPLIELLFKMEERGFKIDESKLDEIGDDFRARLKKVEQEIYIEAGEQFNLNSPKKVAFILFEKLGINDRNNKKHSTSANFLEDLRDIPIVNNILLYRKYAKLVNTYIEAYKNLCQTQGDVIHTTFNQTLTSTGRLSSSEPNLQNIPTHDDDGKILRKIFISKFEGGELLSADYNQIELRLMADMSGEKGLIEAYKKGDDIHTITASKIFNIPIDEVTSVQRRDAKAVNFGVMYGISDFGLSQNIKTTRAKAKEYIDYYFSQYSNILVFLKKNIEFAKEKGYVLTKYGRMRRIPEISSSKYLTRTFGERVAMNMPLQGTASDIIKLAMLKVARSIEEEGLRSELILQIHDELIIDVYPGERERVEKIVKRDMESVASLNVPLIVTIGAGKSLFDCK